MRSEWQSWKMQTTLSPALIIFEGNKKLAEGYLLSAKDFCMISRLQELKDAGVDAIKSKDVQDDHITSQWQLVNTKMHLTANPPT